MRELDIRRNVRLELGRRYPEPDTKIIDELGLCQGRCIVDVAAVNGCISGYEIKSEHDSLGRLPAQMEVYNRTLDAVTIVVGGTHVRRVGFMIPEWWGIWAVPKDSKDGSLVEVRPAEKNPSVDPHAVVQLLWRHETLAALTALGLAKGLTSKPRKILWKALAEGCSTEKLGELVREQLKARQGWRSDSPRTSSGDSSRPSATS